MSQDEIIEMAREAAAKHGHTLLTQPSQETCELLVEFFRMAQASVPKIPRWIPCSEKKPELGVKVMVWEKYLGVYTGYFIQSGVWDCCGFHGGIPPEITHWMPLPAAPSAEGGGPDA